MSRSVLSWNLRCTRGCSEGGIHMDYTPVFEHDMMLWKTY
jgi:hypothetical protein